MSSGSGWNGNRIVRPLDGHPIPFDQDEIDERWESVRDPAVDEPPSVDEAHEEYTQTIAEYGAWRVFRVHYPFPSGHVVFWDSELGEGFKVDPDCGEWHTMVNLFAAIVDEEGDCRDADYSDSLRQSGAVEQHCEGCGGSWTVG